MRKILFSLMTLVLVVGLVGGGAFAYFSDTEESKGNTFTAGTIDLEMNEENPRVSAIFTFSDIKPCKDMEPVVIKLKNVGQNNGYLYQKIDYVDKDKVVEAGSEFVGDMSADKFAALIFVKSIEYQHFCPAYPGGGGIHDDLPDMLAAMDANNDSFVSLYELKLFGWMPYDPAGESDPDPEHTLQVGHTATWTIVFHMADSLDPWTLDGDILTGASAVEDNRPQADGIELTWTAILRQNPANVNPLP